MFRKSDATTRVRLFVLLTALGLSALAPSGASACGGPPAGDSSGPVLGGSTDIEGAQVQPIIYPHCSFTPPGIGGARIEASVKSPDRAARPLNPPAKPN